MTDERGTPKPGSGYEHTQFVEMDEVSEAVEDYQRESEPPGDLPPEAYAEEPMAGASVAPPPLPAARGMDPKRRMIVFGAVAALAVVLAVLMAQLFFGDDGEVTAGSGGRDTAALEATHPTEATDLEEQSDESSAGEPIELPEVTVSPTEGP